MKVVWWWLWIPILFGLKNLSGTERIPSVVKPNIILYLSDDHGAEDAGCFGNTDLNTPVLDQWAAEGMSFTRAYTPASVCAPSRSALFTGLYPHRNGCDRNHGAVNPGIKTLPDYLKPLGYRVVLAGKTHIQPKDQFGFEYIDMHEVPEFLRGVGDNPFCLIVALHTPHQPYFNHKGGYNNITPKTWMPDTEATRRYTGAYYDHVSLLDHELGSYLYWVEKYGFSDALQIYTSDHGPAFPFAKWTLYEHGIRVPLIVKWPGHIQPGTTVDWLVNFVDFLPTLIDAAGGNVPEHLDGLSLVPYLAGEKRWSRENVFAAYTNLGVQGANEFPIRALVSAEYKLIVNLRPENKFQITRMDSPDKRAIIDSYDVLQSWTGSSDPTVRQRAEAHWKRPPLELYDLQSDPDELVNIADDPKYEYVLQHLSTELEEWMAAQNDPETTNLRAILHQNSDSVPNWQRGELIYENDFSSAADVKDWVMEGPGVTEFRSGWMHMYSPDEAYHHVFWCPRDFPDSILVEWEAQNLETDAGLSILFFAAKGVNGQDIFDPDLPARDGDFTWYIKDTLRSYHISYYANTPKKPDRSTAHLRKNNRFNLVYSGEEGIPTRSENIHHMKLIKYGPRIIFYVDDRKVIDWLDDGSDDPRPYYKTGKIGFRQMQWTHFRYRNFRVWKVSPTN